MKLNPIGSPWCTLQLYFWFHQDWTNRWAGIPERSSRGCQRHLLTTTVLTSFTAERFIGSDSNQKTFCRAVQELSIDVLVHRIRKWMTSATHIGDGLGPYSGAHPEDGAVVGGDRTHLALDDGALRSSAVQFTLQFRIGRFKDAAPVAVAFDGWGRSASGRAGHRRIHRPVRIVTCVSRCPVPSGGSLLRFRAVDPVDTRPPVAGSRLGLFADVTARTRFIRFQLPE